MADDLRKPDAYEAEFMGDDDDVVHREKLAAPRWFPALLTAAILAAVGFSGFEAFQAGDMQAVAMVLAALPVMLFMITMISTMRVAVTKDHVDVHYGPLGPKIPIDKIEHCEGEEYSVWKYGGYGIRYSLTEGAWCYNMVGDGGKAVRIHYRTDSGKLKKVLIATKRPAVLADAINRVRLARGHAVPDEFAPDETELGLDEFSDLEDDGVVFETTIGDDGSEESEQVEVPVTTPAEQKA